MKEFLGMSSDRELCAYKINDKSMIKEYFITHRFLDKFVKKHADYRTKRKFCNKKSITCVMLFFIFVICVIY